jgi:hypothetical protein
VDRLDIYADMYFYRIRDALREDFPKLVACLGDDGFHDLVTDYLLVCRPRDASLGRAGDRLPAFLAEHPLAAARPWLAELAALEWARSEVFSERDAAAFGFAEVQARIAEAAGALPLALVPAHRVVATRSAVGALHDRLDEGAPAPTAAIDDAPGDHLVWRRGCAVMHRPLDPLERELVRELAAGTTLGALCDWTCERVGQEPATQALLEHLCRWASDGILRPP